MAATIIVEDGSGVDGANCYFSIDDADAYYEAHPYSSVYDALEADQKKRVAIEACRTVDMSAQLRGAKLEWDQDMEWPRLGVAIDVDPAVMQAPPAIVTGDENVLATGAGAIPANVVPKRYKQACMEMMRFVAAKDRSATFDKPAVIREKIDVIEREFTEAGSAIDLLPEIVQRMIKPFVLSADDAGGGAGANSGGARAVSIFRA